ncbi:MAG: hypothetical protein ACYTFY_01375 [Planctomycetota bacterium]|jgi:hypothetical protein
MSASTLNKIDTKLEQLDPESVRYKVLVALRRFRSSWVELGKLLTEVAYGGDYKEWGYEDFEIYCARELGLKKPTVNKLMISYKYMQKNEPDRLTAHEEWNGSGAPPELPDYQTVELLHKAKENDDLDNDQKNRFHQLAFDESAEEGTLRKEIREAILTAEEGEMSEEKAKSRELGDIRRTCHVLRKKLSDSRYVPMGLRERFEALLAEIEAFD